MPIAIAYDWMKEEYKNIPSDLRDKIAVAIRVVGRENAAVTYGNFKVTIVLINHPAFRVDKVSQKELYYEKKYCSPNYD
jgi:TRAP-type uncharacterized transport system substrate-binding protein